jgi:hypothetical protein
MQKIKTTLVAVLCTLREDSLVTIQSETGKLVDGAIAGNAGDLLKNLNWSLLTRRIKEMTLGKQTIFGTLEIILEDAEDERN